MGVMALKGYTTFPKVPGLEPHHQVQFNVIPLETRCWGVSYPSTEVQPAYYTAPVNKALKWRMANMCRDMNIEILWRIITQRKEFTTIKIVLKTKLDKTLRANLFNNTGLPAMLYTNEIWMTTKKEEDRLVMAQRVMERSMLRILLLE